jgi:hypothetical protein
MASKQHHTAPHSITQHHTASHSTTAASHSIIHRYMGVFANSMWIKIVCWLLAILVITTNIYLVVVSVKDFGNTSVTPL